MSSVMANVRFGFVGKLMDTIVTSVYRIVFHWLLSPLLTLSQVLFPGDRGQSRPVERKLTVVNHATCFPPRPPVLYLYCMLIQLVISN